MDQRFNIYYAGKVLDGRDQAEVRANLGKLFKASEQTLDKLFSGKAQLLKRDCDKATAQKYQQAMQRAGAIAIVRPTQEAKTPATAETMAPNADGQAEHEPQSKPMTAAERIAALAAADDDNRFSSGHATEPAPAQSAPEQHSTTAKTEEPAPQDGSLGLEPAGTAVLKEAERAQPVQREVDTGDLAVDAAAQRLSDEPPAPPPAPDTSHLDIGEVGDTIPNLPRQAQALNPDTSALKLSPEGTDFSDCASEEALAPEIDLSAIDLAPPGGELLQESERKKPDTAPPPTDHLSVED